MSFELARRHRFVRELAALPDGVECHVLPARGTSARDDTIWASRDFSSIDRRIEGTYQAAAAYLDEHLEPSLSDVPAVVTLLLRRLVVMPAVVLLAVLVWVTLPLWLLAAAALSPLLPGRWRVLRLFWLVVLGLTVEALCSPSCWGGGWPRGSAGGCGRRTGSGCTTTWCSR